MMGEFEGHYLALYGKIKTGDLRKIKSYIKREGYPDVIFINSPGGDVNEAIKISSFFRDTFLSIAPVKQCDSACFIVWAGGYNRMSNSLLGLHRPHFQKEYFKSLTYDEAKKEYKNSLEKTKSHLIEMDIPVKIIDKMMSIESSDIYYLSNKEVEENISRYPQIQREWLISKCGNLSDSEEQDLEDIRNYDICSSTDLFECSAQIIKKTQNFSKGYKKFLFNKSADIFNCESDAIESVRTNIQL
ncbi:hypothetical protein [Endozoicomonas sp. 2B-B]